MMVLRALCEDQAQALGEVESSTPIDLEHRPSIPPDVAGDHHGRERSVSLCLRLLMVQCGLSNFNCCSDRPQAQAF